MRLLALFFLIFPICTAICPTDTVCDQTSNKCYKFVSQNAPYFSAEEHCVISFGGHLTSVQNFFENALIGETADSMFAGSSNYWIGANSAETKEWSWTDGSAWKFSNWFPGDPSDKIAGSVILRSHMWTSDDPDSSKPYVCELPYSQETTFSQHWTVKPSTCPSCPTCTACPTSKPLQYCESGWTLYDRTNSCYKVGFNEPFLSAESICKTSGGHLASIHNEEENEFVSNLAYSGHPVNHFETTLIGLFKADGNWQWTDETEVDFFNWGAGAPESFPDHHCCRVFVGGSINGPGWDNKWEANECTLTLRNFVCKKRAL